MGSHQDQVLAALRWALRELGARCSQEDARALAAEIVDCMSGPRRCFHGLAHVLKLVSGASPVQALAALYHDVVYVQVDGGFPAAAADIAAMFYSPAGVPSGALLSCLREGSEDSELVSVVMDVFGVQAGEPLGPFTGLNELASSLLMVRRLGRHLPAKALVRLAVAVEATRPFRAAAPVKLSARLNSANISFGLGFDDKEVVQVTQEAVGLSNRDVGDFAHLDAALFLSGSWLLLPEGTPRLLAADARLGDWRHALGKMLTFISSLKPPTIFNAFEGSPPPQVVAELNCRAEANVVRARAYLRAKILGTALLEALLVRHRRSTAVADLVASVLADSWRRGEASAWGPLRSTRRRVRLAMGELGRSRERAWDRLRLEVEQGCRARLGDGGGWDAPRSCTEEAVLRVLTNGRADPVSFDSRRSPVASVCYACMGEGGAQAAYANMEKTLQGCSADPLGEEEARAVVEAFPADVSSAVEDALLALLGPETPREGKRQASPPHAFI